MWRLTVAVVVVVNVVVVVLVSVLVLVVVVVIVRCRRCGWTGTRTTWCGRRRRPGSTSSMRRSVSQFGWHLPCHSPCRSVDCGARRERRDIVVIMIILIIISSSSSSIIIIIVIMHCSWWCEQVFAFFDRYRSGHLRTASRECFLAVMTANRQARAQASASNGLFSTGRLPSGPSPRLDPAMGDTAKRLSVSQSYVSGMAVSSAVAAARVEEKKGGFPRRVTALPLAWPHVLCLT
jgi:hypothetical protein